MLRLLAAGWLLSSLVSSATFPCGPSFTPCDVVKAFGSRTREFHAITDGFLEEKDDTKKKEILKSISHDKILIAARDAVTEVERTFNKTEKDLLREITARSFSPAELSWSRFTRADQYSKYLSYSALVSIRTAQRLASSVPTKAIDMMPFFPTQGTDIANTCPVGQIEECVAGKYRSYSGHCNNILKPLQGAVYEPLKRLLSADYADKISNPRVSASGAPLTSAAVVSQLFTPSPKGHASCSLLLAQWAAFIYDDLAHVGSNRLIKDGFFSGSEHYPLPCCRDGLDHSECYPIRYVNSRGEGISL